MTAVCARLAPVVRARGSVVGSAGTRSPEARMRTLRTVLAAATLAALAAARPAEARTSLGLGADWLVDPEAGELQLTLALETRLAKHLSLGARLGAMYLSEPDRFGAPIDGRLRIRAGGVYLDGLVGPWIVLDDDDAVRLHAALGFGILTHSLSFGLEVGWLDPTSMIGVRVAFPL